MNSVAMVTIILQVTLPTAITKRYGHSAVIFGIGPNFRVIVLFGGRTSSVHPLPVISETTLLLMSKSPPNELYSALGEMYFYMYILHVLSLLTHAYTWNEQ